MRIGKLRMFEKNIIGHPDDPLVIRYVLFRIPAFGIFLHKLCRSDHDRALHDHPWTFISVVLRQGYGEMTEDNKTYSWHRPGSVLYRPAEWQHRVIIEGKPAWTLVFLARRRRLWGFWPNRKFCYWKRYDFQKGICSEFDVHTADYD